MNRSSALQALLSVCREAFLIPSSWFRALSLAQGSQQALCGVWSMWPQAWERQGEEGTCCLPDEAWYMSGFLSGPAFHSLTHGKGEGKCWEK